MKLKFDLVDGTELNKKVINRLILIIMVLIVVCISVLIYYENSPDTFKVSKDDFYLFEYNGKIKNTYRSAKDRHWMTVFEDGTEKELLFDFAVWERLKPGDILIKHKKELNFIIISGEDTTFYKE